MTVASLQQFSFDSLFLTVGGIDLASGLTEYNLEDAAVKRAAFASSRRRIAVTDSSKLGKTAFARICSVEDLDILITDSSASEVLVHDFRNKGVDVMVV
jgi:DeoR/GlpR family transcriptional regulator of sugar metabolism